MNISSFEKCANCGACYSICPKAAISIHRNALFYEPKIDTELCIDCGACVKVCPVNQEITGVSPISACAGWHKEEDVVLNSSSGGAFYSLSKEILAQGGIVFGAAYAEDCKTVEFVSTDDVSLKMLQKSKYVESLVGTAFQRVKAELEKGRIVLFCGTPCQVAGLKLFLRKDYEMLLTCDFACGGLPSHKIYQNYLRELELKYHASVKSIDFRPKTYGWKQHAMWATFENGKVYDRLGAEDPYLKSFLFGKLTVRDYCLECKFSDRHLSDITIADFWMHHKLSALEHEDGISLILCNTEKGEKAVNGIKEQFVFENLDVAKVSYNHKETKTSAQDKAKRIDFLKIYEENDLSTACKRFFHSSLKNKIRNRISMIIHRRSRGGK
ncbi:MAG: Coenzyme F420 hydrogenase/dehydrogenase, beta subunit C-terminal domain [Clostridia bacterium]|nr:Coenzyme F420 hydrogenase/dehydrogenase, beta subunit C-terminal domain [Clostridia bacterium]